MIIMYDIYIYIYIHNTCMYTLCENPVGPGPVRKRVTLGGLAGAGNNNNSENSSNNNTITLYYNSTVTTIIAAIIIAIQN